MHHQPCQGTVETPQFFGFSLFSNTKPYQSLLLQVKPSLSTILTIPCKSSPLPSFQALQAIVAIVASPRPVLARSLQEFPSRSIVAIDTTAEAEEQVEPWRMKTPFDTT
jgi:hypothetical protein